MAQEKPPQLTVAGTCGSAVTLPVNGVDVMFTCSPTKTPVGPILGPQDPGGGQLATIIMSDTSEWLRAELFTPREEIDMDAQPIVLSAPSGSTLDMGDVKNALQIAKNEHRPVVVEIHQHGDR
jgi:hypothetical protein